MAGVETIVTDDTLPAGNRVMIWQRPEGLVYVFVHRPALLEDPEGVIRELLYLSDRDVRSADCAWRVAV